MSLILEIWQVSKRNFPSNLNYKRKILSDMCPLPCCMSVLTWNHLDLCVDAGPFAGEIPCKLPVQHKVTIVCHHRTLVTWMKTQNCYHCQSPQDPGNRNEDTKLRLASCEALHIQCCPKTVVRSPNATHKRNRRPIVAPRVDRFVTNEFPNIFHCFTSVTLKQASIH